MNEVQNFANFHTCYLPYGLKFFHKGHPKHKLNYSWPNKDLLACLDLLKQYFYIKGDFAPKVPFLKIEFSR